ncbi:MAG: hypothetical protein Unbinned5081contig1001_49 [Prokaryotic dsDNA virus sp.]|nr:MAG: hypothetical protein Unbinned5081contig1001_49 [Prokaryotic dsDNA virus sp.]|tara:strand:- start:14322 stop:15044 length:723 start_codon:yes stop_codon:yes gene_type:complete
MTNEQKTVTGTDVIRGMEQAIEMAGGKTEAPEQSDMVDVLIRALERAERVVVETPNALGEMDAHYLHAPELLTAWNTRTDLSKAAVGAAVRSTLENVIDHIFDHGNGDVNTYNGEPTWLVGDDLVQAIIEPEAQQALDKLLGEKYAEGYSDCEAEISKSSLGEANAALHRQITSAKKLLAEKDAEREAVLRKAASKVSKTVNEGDVDRIQNAILALGADANEALRKKLQPLLSADEQREG